MARQHQKLLRRERAQTIAEPDAPALMPPGPASYDDAREICEPAPGSRAFAYQAELTPHFARCVSAVYYPNPSGGKIYGKDMQSAAVEANYDFLLRYFV